MSKRSVALTTSTFASFHSCSTAAQSTVLGVSPEEPEVEVDVSDPTTGSFEGLHCAGQRF